MRRNGTLRVGVEGAQFLRIGGGAKMGFCWQRIEQRQLQAGIAHPAIEDGAGFSARAFLGEIGGDRNGGDDLRGLDRHTIRIAGAEADAKEAAVRGRKFAHSASLAIAFKAAAAMALPPLRPLRVTKGTRASAMSASFDSAAPTNPTGIPITQAGRAKISSSISSRRYKAVGALPMAAIAPSSLSRQNSSAAALRVVPSFRASDATAGLSRVRRPRSRMADAPR